jgi:hypothetical protein
VTIMHADGSLMTLSTTRPSSCSFLYGGAVGAILSGIQGGVGRDADLGAGHLGAAAHAAPGAGAADGAPRRRSAADLPRRRLPTNPAAGARRGVEQAQPARLRHRHPVTATTCKNRGFLLDVMSLVKKKKRTPFS